jgi:hypothetical protein
MSTFPSQLFLFREPLCRVPLDINLDPSMKSALADSESPKVDKPPSPQAERTMPDSPKPSSPKGAQGSPSVDGALTSPNRTALDKDPTGACLVPGPTKSPRASPPSPRSHGLESTSGSQCGEGSFAPQPEEVSWQRSRVV